MDEISAEMHSRYGRASPRPVWRHGRSQLLAGLMLSMTATVWSAAPHDRAGAQQPNARPVLVDSVVTGNLPDADSVEAFRFSLAAQERVAVTVLPPADGAIAVRVGYADGRPLATVAQPAIGVPWAWIGQLPPADYEVEIRAAVPSRGDYRLGIERLDPFAISQDQEPNDTLEQARPVPVFKVISGTRSADSDIDWYRIEPLAVPTALTLLVSGAPGALHISDGTREYPIITDTATGRIRTVMLPAGPPLYLVIVPDGEYEIRFESGIPTPSGRPIPARLLEAYPSVTMTSPVVAAGWPDPQRLTGMFTLWNEARDDKQVSLDTLTSDMTWVVEIDRRPIVLGGSGTLAVPMTIIVPPLARAEVPVRATIRASAKDGTQVTGFVDVTPVLGAPPMNE